MARVSATEAPSPKLVPPLEAAVAVDVDWTLEAALTVSVPAPAAAEPVAPSSAVVATFPTVSANEPAALTVPPPEPEVASASNVCFAPAPFIEAVIATPLPLIMPLTTASFATLARSMATAAPIAAAPACVADASAFAVALVAAEDATVARPPADTEPPEAIEATELLFAMFTATAAETVTAPVDVLALGVDVPPEPAPPAALDAASAFERSPAT